MSLCVSADCAECFRMWEIDKLISYLVCQEKMERFNTSELGSTKPVICVGVGVGRSCIRFRSFFPKPLPGGSEKLVKLGFRV